MTWKKQKRHDFIQFKAGFPQNFTSRSRQKNSYWLIRDLSHRHGPSSLPPIEQLKSWDDFRCFDSRRTLGLWQIAYGWPSCNIIQRHHLTVLEFNKRLGIHNWVILDVMRWIPYENVNPSYLHSKPSETKVDTGYICLPRIPALLGVNGRTYNLQPRCFMFCSKALTEKGTPK